MVSELRRSPVYRYIGISLNHPIIYMFFLNMPGGARFFSMNQQYASFRECFWVDDSRENVGFLGEVFQR